MARKLGLADRLKRIVKDSGVTLYRISKDSGINQTTLQRFMRGEMDLTLGKAQLLTDYFGVQFTEPEYPKGRE